MSHPPTAEDELAVLQRALDRRRHHVDPETGQCAVCNRMTDRKASGPATRGSGEAEKRDRGGGSGPEAHMN